MGLRTQHLCVLTGLSQLLSEFINFITETETGYRPDDFSLNHDRAAVGNYPMLIQIELNIVIGSSGRQNRIEIAFWQNGGQASIKSLFAA
ncbi:Uncharacterised protein [Vibrio cholerae]|uniref:Uncharacterized protein n=1 Tax=Vibrio cholerae TaxID=666 RepID=A0A655X733_VIBCL|nr:Uncharacterised protein [Vibrio cholerae]